MKTELSTHDNQKSSWLRTVGLNSRVGFLATGVAIGALAISAFGSAATQADALSTLTPSDAAVLGTVGAQAVPKALTNQAGLFSFADVVENVTPSVVSVLVERSVEVRPRARALPPGFERFFGFPGAPEGGNDGDDPFEDEGTQRAEAQGSGFFIDSQGHIVTNHHVIDDAESVRVRLSDGSEIDAEIVGSDEFTDLAVLKIKGSKKHPFVSFADEGSLRVGDWVVAIGNPFGLGGTVTSGIVSAIGGQNREQQYVDLIQIDAAINRGNSGGPAFDLAGNVIGINVAIYSPNGGSVGIGFAIPASTAKSTVKQLIENGAVTRGWLGISLGDVSDDIAQALSLSSTDGVLVQEVLEGTPAAKGGIENGDVITDVDGKAVSGPNDLSRRIANYPPGRKVKMKLVRNGAKKELTITLGKRDDTETVAAVRSPAEDSVAEELGVRVSSLTPENRARYRIDDDAKGVVVTAVKSGSPAADAGLQTGVVITEIDSQTITSPRDFETKIDQVKKSKKGAALLRLQRGTVKQYSALKLNAGE